MAIVQRSRLGYEEEKYSKIGEPEPATSCKQNVWKEARDRLGKS